MNNEKNSVKEIPGFGIAVPPVKSHVLLYFTQKGQSEEKAISFYEKYCNDGWKNRKGKIIKNWKVHAWQWIWEK